MTTTAAPLEDDGFTSVTYKKSTRAPKNRKGKNRFRERTLEEKLQAREDALRRSGYLVKCRELVRDSLISRNPSDDSSPSSSTCPAPRVVVCLGLGSVSDSTKAQDQYVLLKELVLELGDIIDKNEPIQFYDPVFSPEDSAFLISQGHKVLSCEFELKLVSPTFLYIPHGPRSLFNALIEQNWSAAQLSKMIIFGNRLDLYDDPTYSGTTRQSGEADVNKLGELEGGMEWIRKAAPLFEIVPLPTTKEHLEAFNDLALEWADPARLEQAVAEGRLPREADTEAEQLATTADSRDDKSENKEAGSLSREAEGVTEALDALSLATTDEAGGEATQ